MSRRRARTDAAQEPGLPRWPMFAGALAMLVGVGVGGYTAGVFVSETRSETEGMTVVSGILVEPSPAPEQEPEEEEEEPEEETHPAGIDPEVTYALLNTHGERALDVAGASTDNGAPTHLWDRHDEGNQQWRFVPIDDGFYEIVGVGSGKLLEIPGEPAPEGEPVVASLLTRTGSPNQHWTVVEVGEDVVRLVNRATGHALESKEGSPENGTPIIPAEGAGHAHQKWRLVPLG
ncbi:RICIN domain-containing protein [Nocardiopsis alkaliphila]|uniref:RICIN domain-containing protein n=1 Tax=Nocardiopsis alkaliphila TaxID=225762 RepID=UPI00034AE017|nr:RICIN domain-containing protein [Nocardiopsis alkaliphila]